jgi:hypothetical protein
MTTRRAPPALGHIDDHELEHLATTWRRRALRGDREAYGIAHALEVEARRRQRVSQMAQLPPEPVPTRRRWQFWKRLPLKASDSPVRDG